MAHRLSLRAEVYLDDIWMYVATESSSIEVATRLIDSIMKGFLFLGDFPYAGRLRDRDFGFRSRSFPVGEYLIVYCVEDFDVLILRVVHGRRDLWTLPVMSVRGRLRPRVVLHTYSLPTLARSGKWDFHLDRAARFGGIYGIDNQLNMRSKIWLLLLAQDDNGNRSTREILLVCHILIDRQQKIESCLLGCC